jgi:GTP-binding protein
MERVPVEEGIAGDIIAVAGSDAGITDTLAGPGTAEALDPGRVDPPTLR